MGQIVSKAMIRPHPGLAVAVLCVVAAACSTSSAQSGGGWPDSSVEGGDDATTEAGDDVGTGDAPAGDSSGPACPCGATFKTCPASRPCVTGVATEPSCAGQVCCGPASACDGGLDAGDAGGMRDAARDAPHDGARDAGKG
jgi:hypothetical protein